MLYAKLKKITKIYMQAKKLITTFFNVFKASKDFIPDITRESSSTEILEVSGYWFNPNMESH